MLAAKPMPSESLRRSLMLAAPPQPFKATSPNLKRSRLLLPRSNGDFGKLDILVNNAGIHNHLPIDQITAEDFHRHYNLNVLGPLLAIKEAVGLIGGEGGSIVNIGSVNSTMGIPGSSVYAGTKGALNSITLSLSKELGPRKIRVDAINPGLIETEGTQSRGFIEGKTLETVLKLTPLGRIGQPEDIGRIAAFLASDDSYWLNGEIVNAAGGMTI